MKISTSRTKVYLVLTMVFLCANSNFTQAHSTSKVAVKTYLAMSEEQQKQFVAQQAEAVSFAFGNKAGFAVEKRITPIIMTGK